MKLIVTAALLLFAVGVKAQLSQEQREKLSQQLQKESVDLENKVCADPAYKPDCDHLKKGNADEVRAAVSKFAPDSPEIKQLREKIEGETNAFEDKIYADPKYSAAYKHIQLLHEQLGIPHHGKSK